MARAARTTSKATRPAAGRNSGRVAAAAKGEGKPGPSKKDAAPRVAAKRTAPAARASAKASAAVKASVAPKLSKEDLRERVEKLERANAALRAKGRESTRAAKDASARIAELESEVAKLTRQAAAAGSAAKRPDGAAPGRRGRGREIDPGDAVPPGVAVAEPEPLDREAETALANLEAHVHGD